MAFFLLNLVMYREQKGLFYYFICKIMCSIRQPNGDIINYKMNRAPARMNVDRGCLPL